MEKRPFFRADMAGLGSIGLKQNGNTTSGSEIMNVNVFLTIFPLISIINNFPLICQ